MQLEKAAKKYGIKPMFGLEAYMAPDKERRKWHLTILTMNQRGYQNLNQIVTKSYENFYQFPTVSMEILSAHSQGLIILSGCADSQLSCILLGGKSLGEKRTHASTEDITTAYTVVKQFKEIFGDRYYLECQQFPELERTRILNPIFARISRRCGVPLVGTADVHYVSENESEMRKILHAAGRGTGTVEAAEQSWEYDIPCHIPTGDKLVLERLVGTGLTKIQAQEAIANTAEIANRCNVTLPKAEPLRYPGTIGDLEPW